MKINCQIHIVDTSGGVYIFWGLILEIGQKTFNLRLKTLKFCFNLQLVGFCCCFTGFEIIFTGFNEFYWRFSQRSTSTTCSCTTFCARVQQCCQPWSTQKIKSTYLVAYSAVNSNLKFSNNLNITIFKYK